MTGQGVPANASAVVLNLTGVQSASLTDVRAYPTPAAGNAFPDVSNLNVFAGETVANQVTVPVGDAGRVRLRSAGGALDLVADVAGYYLPAGTGTGNAYRAVDPVRFLDTRTGQGTTARGALGPGATLDLLVAGGSSNVPSAATAVVLASALVAPSSGTDLRAYPTPSSGSAVPNASNLNAAPGETIANVVTATVGAGGKVRFRNAAGNAHVISDVAGFYVLQ